MAVLTGDLQESCVEAHTVIPVLKRLRQEDHMFKIKLGYLASYCLKKPKPAPNAS